MKKQLLFSLLAIFLISACNNVPEYEANNDVAESPDYSLSPEAAKGALVSFIEEGVTTKSDNPVEIVLSKELSYEITDNTISSLSKLPSEQVKVYEYSVEDETDSGFAIVIGDERINTVLAYAPKGSLSDTSFIEPLAAFHRNIPLLVKDALLSFYSDNNFVLTRNPPAGSVLYTDEYNCTTKSWGQNSPYNLLFPACAYTADGRALTGCINTAIAEVAAYIKKPTTGVTASDWTIINGSTSGSQYQTKISGLFNLLQSYTLLTISCTSLNQSTGGQVQNIKNGLTGIGLNYSYTATYNFTNIYNSIQTNKPAILVGWAGSAGHAWVVDGARFRYYVLNDETYPYPNESNSKWLRMNWGWDGNSNGWLLAHSPSFTGGGYTFGSIETLGYIY